ncbi:hypothetical protein H6G00_19245 [Leptolyngbya sp. FACHB-541]|nr:hypothetical protein [Leptolyngbya sp. FACHB-541]MBD1998735.1 hypothetical protein [Leptolyngbya sp. FACHB-541]
MFETFEDEFGLPVGFWVQATQSRSGGLSQSTHLQGDRPTSIPNRFDLRT